MFNALFVKTDIAGMIMTLVINGSIFLQNGYVPADIGSGEGETEAVRNDAGIQTRVPYLWKVVENGDFIIELQNLDNLADSISDNMKDTQDLIRMAVNIIESALLLNVVRNGAGLLYIIKSLKKPDGTLIEFPAATQIRENPEVPFDLNKLIGPTGLGRNLRLRGAIKDFNWGLLDRDSAPFFFYRQIETLAKIVLKLELEFLNSRQQWEDYYKKIGASQKERDFFENVLKKQYANFARHGTYLYYTADDFYNMLLVSRIFLIKTIGYLDLLQKGYKISDVDSLLK